MTLWLTLLLVWTTGIPAAVFAGATVTARLHERRLARVGRLFASRALALRPAQRCHRRVHGNGMAFAYSRRGFAARRR
jgi:hypothetical protein